MSPIARTPIMPSRRLKLLAPVAWAALLALPAGPAHAELRKATLLPPSRNTYLWVGGDGDWNDPAHWQTSATGPQVTPVPLDLDTVRILADDDVDRTISFPGPGGLPADNHAGLTFLQEISNAGSGLITLKITDGSIGPAVGKSIWFNVGQTGQGRIVQTAGLVESAITLGNVVRPWSTGRYELLGGELHGGVDVHTSASGMLVDGGLHEGSFIEVASAGSYELHSGRSVIGWLGMDNGRYRQTGGQASIDSLWLGNGSLFQWSGGDLGLGSVTIDQYPNIPPSRMVFPSPGQTVTLRVDGIADFGPGDQLVNAERVRLNLGPESLLLVRPGGNLLTRFASVESVGFVHATGQTLTIPAGRTVRGVGNIPDHVEVRGRLLNSVSDDEDSLLTVTGLTLHDGAEARGVMVLAAGPTPTVIHGGTLVGSIFTSPEQPTTIIQHDGSARLQTLSVWGGTTADGVPVSSYELRGGAMDVGSFYLYGGRFTVANRAASIHIHDLWRITPGSQYIAAPGTTITLDACTVDVLATDSRDVAGLAQTTLVFSHRERWASALEPMGRDLGPSLAAFRDNFTLGGLVLVNDGTGTELTVGYRYDNRSGVDGPEALYVKNLVLDAGTTLVLDGVNVYYQRLTDLGGTLEIVGSGGLVPVGRLAGDFSGDGRVDAQDINPFILALTNADAYATAYPWLDLLSADLNGDGRIDLRDVSPFVAALSDQGITVDPQMIPEPSTLALLVIGMAVARRRRA